MQASNESHEEITNDATSGSSEAVVHPPPVIINEEDGDNILVTGINYHQGTTTHIRPSQTESVGPNERPQEGSSQSRRFDGTVVVDQQPQQDVIGKGQPTAFSTQQGECGILAEEHVWISNDILNEHQGKTSLDILCVSAGTPGKSNYIENCTALEKTKDCLERQLGHATICIGEDNLNVTMSEMESLKIQLSKLTLPKHFTRVMFYFFGHATEHKLVVADGVVDKDEVVQRIASISSSDNVFKILMFDCCRMNGNISRPDVRFGQYPKSFNTLVINATQIYAEAFYYVDAGCGFMTRFFVELAPTMNCSFFDLLNEMRRRIAAEVKQANLACQILVYEDKLMGRCYLLAESQGESRVVPTAVRCSDAVISTNIHFQFDAALESRIKGFLAQVLLGSDVVTSSSALVCDRMATVTGLKPGTSYSARIVVIYSDGAELTSDKCDFYTPVRQAPSDIRVVPKYRGSSACRVHWNFNDETSNLDGFCVEVKTKGETTNSVKCNVPNFTSGTLVKGFVPGEKHIVTVIALYRDGKNEESSIEHDHGRRYSPENFKISQSIPGSNKATLSWKFSAKYDDVRSFMIRLMKEDGTAEEYPVAIPEGSGEEMKYVVENLSPLTKYLIVLTAQFNDGYHSEDEVLEHINCARPLIDVGDKTQTTVEIIIKEEDTEVPEELRVTGIRYSVREHGGGEEGSGNNNGRTKEYRDFKPPYKGKSTSMRKSQQEKRKISKLKSSKKYSLMVQVEYGGKNYVESGPYDFETTPYTGCQKAGCCALFIFLLLLGLALLFLALFLCSTYVTSQLLLSSQEVCSTYYSLATDDVQCGSANALNFGTMKISGKRQNNDLLSGNVLAWLAPKDNLTFYSQQYSPLNRSGSTNKQERILLTGWQIYTWIGSVIAGYCCITNSDVTEKTANLHIFTSDTDSEWFINSSRTTHSIFSDSITIPPGHLECFRKWGANEPFITSLNSYHYIGVDIPGESNFTYNVTILQKFVNGSDYGSPHYFNRANSTTLSLPSSSLFTNEEYVAICEAPMYVSLEQSIHSQMVPSPIHALAAPSPYSISKYGSGSLHIKSCNEPYLWRRITFPTLLVVGLLMIVIIILSYILTCYRMYKSQDRLYLSCSFCKKS